MKCCVNLWTERQFGVELALTNDELDVLIDHLRALRADNDQHFHVSAFAASATLRDIEISVHEPFVDDLRIGGFALAPGDSIADP